MFRPIPTIRALPSRRVRLLVAVILAVAGTAQAATVQVAFQGVIKESYGLKRVSVGPYGEGNYEAGYGDLNPFGYTTTTQFSGLFTYDNAVPAQPGSTSERATYYPDPTLTLDIYLAEGTRRVSASGPLSPLAMGPEPWNVDGDLAMRLILSFSSNYNNYFQDMLPGGDPWNAGNSGNAQFRLSDFDRNLFTDASLPYSPGDGAELERMYLDVSAGRGVSGPITYPCNSPEGFCTEWPNEIIQFRGEITSLDSTVVPTPPAVWLFGSALGVMGWMRRKAA